MQERLKWGLGHCPTSHNITATTTAAKTSRRQVKLKATTTSKCEGYDGSHAHTRLKIAFHLNLQSPQDDTPFFISHGGICVPPLSFGGFPPPTPRTEFAHTIPHMQTPAVDSFSPPFSVMRREKEKIRSGQNKHLLPHF
ncbi:hypothetical protein, unlikely [Trypanosoma brucei gambiense DAL972]|uniref:Uncharacterized protein n=1 Tax=Trypanosoma brucei gambiense (strain MHOM/CI/86/DAL972) TaxID=679716 RepID=D0A6H4_TRYB9|nr:hypothetical protein, unlikely [Trypanosoma brucei gambiense DAL972]CBH17275.1 hypothetical protein, unlikely [Trypanosoma brucei gambiense DAL972]|eukprot:XP_011779539.1 hypothetical protein, unlikely [Trypanosoma brucei gambiense DAL972]